MQQVPVQATVIKDVTVTAKTNLELIQEAAERIRNDPEKLKQFLRSVMGPDRRTLEGSEREHMLTVFNLIEPIETSNNQRTWTDVYEHAGKIYHVHYFDMPSDVVVEEVIPDDIQ